LAAKAGKVRLPGGRSVVACAILGLRERTERPKSVDLTIDPGGLHHPCTPAWNAGPKIGVRFQTAAII